MESTMELNATAEQCHPPDKVPDPNYQNKHFLDENENPAGGMTCGIGFCIAWQNGVPGRGNDRGEPNGAFAETILIAARDRLQFYQDSKFFCDYNERAIVHIDRAIMHLRNRMKDREKRQVEGTHEQ